MKAIFRISLLLIIGLNNKPVQSQIASAGLDQASSIVPAYKNEHQLTKKETQKIEYLQSRFKCFGSIGSSASYTITLCADLPVNDHPEIVHAGNEPGHVFIILSKTDSFSTTSIAFGFYPGRPLASLFFKKVKSKILESHSREYDVSVSRTINEVEFQLLQEKAIELSLKKYDLNRYNCYDYALQIFNSIPGIEKIPVSKTQFPFPFGSGGSPCCLYNDLKTLKDKSEFWKGSIHFGQFKSPPNCKN